MLVKLFGGPLDGQSETVVTGCEVLRLHERSNFTDYFSENGSSPVKLYTYRRSPDDPSYFIYEDTEEK